MSDKGKGFVLTPSRLGKPPVEENGATKPKFTGLKQSKLGSVGILADSKLSVLPSSNSFSNTSTDVKITSDSIVKPSTFSFTPLTRPVGEDTENSLFSNSEAVSANKDTSNLFSKDIHPTDEKSDTPQSVFGENLSGKAVPPVDSTGPVFGMNLAEKAIVPHEKSQGEDKTSSTTETSELQFSSVSAIPKLQEEDKKTLTESAAEYTESHTNKRKYDEVAVVTGEEEESNVLQSNVKLYLFDTDSKNWTERGRGLIRLNDAADSTPEHIRSRLVMRTHGSLRVVLNTKLWAEMVCEKVNDKNIRISAWDEDVIRIFLLTASPKDAEKLFNALECRISQLKLDKEDTGEPSPKKKSAESE